jgi:hypothetical protein
VENWAILGALMIVNFNEFLEKACGKDLEGIDFRVTGKLLAENSDCQGFTPNV